MQPTVVGLLVGILLGLALILDGFSGMIVVAFFGALGYLVVKVVQGDIDLTQYLGGSSDRRQR